MWLLTHNILCASRDCLGRLPFCLRTSVAFLINKNNTAMRVSIALDEFPPPRTSVHPMDEFPPTDEFPPSGRVSTYRTPGPVSTLHHPDEFQPIQIRIEPQIFAHERRYGLLSHLSLLRAVTPTPERQGPADVKPEP